MSTAAQTKANRINGARSRGPVTAEGKARSCLNGLRDGLRARTLILPGENAQEFEIQHEQLIDDLQPRDGTEHVLIHEIASASWMQQRTSRAQFYRLKTYIEGAGDREAEDVAMNLDRLFRDVCGPTGAYGISSAACGGPRTSSPENVDDPNNKPSVLIKRLEATAKGCQALIDNWRSIAERVEQGLEVQAHDRLRAIRMLGRQPVDAAVDERVWLIFVASFALHPLGKDGEIKDHAFEDLKSDFGTLELKAFLDRVLSRWPLLLSAHDTPRAKQMLLDLIARNVERLEAKLEAHLEHADERAASIAASLAWDESPQGERLARYEMACERRVHRCRDVFWKYRAKTEDGGGRTEDGGRRAEDGREGREGGNVADSCSESGVALEASHLENKKFTTEPNLDMNASEVGTEKEVEAIAKQFDQTLDALLGKLDRGFGSFGTRVAGGGSGLAAIQEAILARGPLLPPIS